ncbi:MAG: hypothetical protein MJ094_00185 [Saccharofermentans sp.]|nr:hypothetical protein [Saccharofermentans sp.]
MPETFPEIDYEELISSLGEDLENNYIEQSDNVFIVRQKTAVFCEACGKAVFPVIDYFYDSLPLMMDIKEYTVKECKKICFDAIERLSDDKFKALRDAISLIIEDLKDYTKGSSKRNERKCKVVFEETNNAPIMVYFDNNDAGDKVEVIGVNDLLLELNSCQL